MFIFAIFFKKKISYSVQLGAAGLAQILHQRTPPRGGGDLQPGLKLLAGKKCLLDGTPPLRVGPLWLKNTPGPPTVSRRIHTLLLPLLPGQLPSLNISTRYNAWCKAHTNIHTRVHARAKNETKRTHLLEHLGCLNTIYKNAVVPIRTVRKRLHHRTEYLRSPWQGSLSTTMDMQKANKSICHLESTINIPLTLLLCTSIFWHGFCRFLSHNCGSDCS